MSTFIWISRHRLTEDQACSLREHGFTDIRQVGDIDAFDSAALRDAVFDVYKDMSSKPTVGVVHPAAALAFKDQKRTVYQVAVSRNINRAPDGERPQFEFDGWVFF